MRVLVSWLRELVDVALRRRGRARAAPHRCRGSRSRAGTGLDEGLAGRRRRRGASVREPIAETKLSVMRRLRRRDRAARSCAARRTTRSATTCRSRPPARCCPSGKAIGAGEAARASRAFGMLCSAKELGLEDVVDGLLILAARRSRARRSPRCSGWNDVALEVNVTPNRADALSHLGVARELGASSGEPPPPPPKRRRARRVRARRVVSDRSRAAARATSRASSKASRIGPSPAWLRTG